MTIVKWKSPYTSNGAQKGSVAFNSPFAGLFENLIGENFFNNGYASFVPAVNISEEEKYYHVELSAPGFEKEDFKLELDNGVLTVSGKHQLEKETKEKSFTRKEFGFGSFQRSFSLPETVNENEVDAKYENGILKIAIAKREEPKKEVREIKIS